MFSLCVALLIGLSVGDPLLLSLPGGGRSVGLFGVRQSVGGCAFAATTEYLFVTSDASVGARKLLQAQPLTNLMQTAGGSAEAVALLDDPNGKAVWAVVASSDGGVSFSKMTDCRNGTFSLEADVFLQYVGTQWYGASDNTGFESKNGGQVSLVGSDRLLTLGFIDTVNGRMPGPVAIVKFGQNLTLDSIFLGRSSQMGSAFLVSSKGDGYQVSSRGVNRTSQVGPPYNSETVTAFRSFGLPTPMIDGSTWGGAILATADSQSQPLLTLFFPDDEGLNAVFFQGTEDAGYGYGLDLLPSSFFDSASKTLNVFALNALEGNGGELSGGVGLSVLSFYSLSGPFQPPKRRPSAMHRIAYLGTGWQGLSLPSAGFFAEQSYPSSNVVSAMLDQKKSGSVVLDFSASELFGGDQPMFQPNAGNPQDCRWLQDSCPINEFCETTGSAGANAWSTKCQSYSKR